MSTPTEIVRAELDWWDKCHKMERPHGLFEFYPALAAVLLDAERFKALELAHLNPPFKGSIAVKVFDPESFSYVLYKGELGELADRLREEKK